MNRLALLLLLLATTLPVRAQEVVDHIDQLTGDDPEGAYAALVELGPDAMPDLVQAIGEVDLETGWQVVRVMAAIGRVESAPKSLLKKTATNSDLKAEQRWFAIHGLAMVGQEKTAAGMWGDLLEEPASPREETMAWFGLQACGEAGSKAAAKLATARDPRLNTRAITALAGYREKLGSASKTLVKVLKDEEQWYLAMSATRGLERAKKNARTIADAKKREDGRIRGGVLPTESHWSAENKREMLLAMEGLDHNLRFRLPRRIRSFAGDQMLCKGDVAQSLLASLVEALEWEAIPFEAESWTDYDNLRDKLVDLTNTWQVADAWLGTKSKKD